MNNQETYFSCSTCQSFSKTPFKKCSVEDVIGIFDQRNLKHFNYGDHIFIEGSNVEGIYFISSGLVKQLKTDKLGDIHTLRISQANDILGLNDIIDSKHTHTASAIAMEPTSVYFIPSYRFIRLLRKTPSFSIEVMRYISDQINVLEHKIDRML